MENAMILLYDMCRLCLDEPGTDNIFEPVDMSQDIFIYTGVKVTTTDGMPQTICASCRDIINCVKILKDIANVNDRQLQTLRGSNDQSTHSQNESGGRPEITSSVNVSLKSRLIFEDDVKDKLKSKTDKLRRKKRKSLSKPENSSAPKIIAVRTDLYESSATVSSSSSRHMESSPTKDLTSSKYSEKEGKDDENSASSNKTVTSSTKKCTPSPTPTTSPNKDPEKLVKVGENTPKVFKFEHQCETCNKSYATPKKLYLHQLAHNKKFLCPLDVCGKKFAIKGDLQKHIRSHTGEKPFKCDLCEQSFTQKGSLKTHKENIHNEPQSQTRTEYSQ